MARPSRSLLTLAGLALVAAAFVVGPRGRPFGRPPLHVNPNMDVQPRAEPQAASAFFFDGAAMRPPVTGTVARGELRDDSPFWTGTDASGFVAKAPVTVDDALLARGKQRYDIYCAVCHDANGDGKGVLAERAKVRTPTYHDDRLRQVPDGYLYLVITNGFGLMPAYSYPIPVADRWAIVAHVRTLQARRLERTTNTTGGTAGAAPPAPAEPAATAATP
jgi:mono/diheme cytochrome c family protein